MRPVRITITPDDANLTLFASNVTGATWTLTTNDTSDGLAHQVTIKNDSANDHSGKTAVITGTLNNRVVSETINLPGAAATVTSTEYYDSVTTVVPSATIGADTMDIGMAGTASTQVVPLNWRGDKVALRVDVSGTVDYTVQSTFDDVTLDFNDRNYAWLDHDQANLVNGTTSQNGNYDKIPTATRCILNSYGSGGSIVFTIIHNHEGI